MILYCYLRKINCSLNYYIVLSCHWLWKDSNITDNKIRENVHLRIDKICVVFSPFHNISSGHLKKYFAFIKLIWKNTHTFGIDKGCYMCGEIHGIFRTKMCRAGLLEGELEHNPSLWLLQTLEKQAGPASYYHLCLY